MSKNIVTLLHKRQVSQWSWGSRQQLALSLTTSHISLTQIMDQDRELLHGHVILGFTRSGNHLISYQCQIDTSSSEHCYTLHWWLFNLHLPLSHVCSHELFRGMPLYNELHLIVSQTLDEKHTVIFGCSRKACANEDRRSCYITILPAPHSPPPTSLADSFSLHFKFDLLAPFPAFIPALSLRMPGCIVLNTGDSLVAVSYTVRCRMEERAPPSPHPSLRPHSTQTVQLFSPPSSRTENENSPGCSPGHVFPVEVFWGEHPLTSLSSTTQEGECVEVQQTGLDVELWMNETLQSELEARGFTFRSLTDYDVQMVEVCGERGDVVFIAVVMLEACGHSPSGTDMFSLEITASWNICNGQARALQFSELKPVPILLNLGPQVRWNPAASLALQLRKTWHLPSSPLHTVRAFSNHTVFSGRSLHSLPHPHLPVSVVLRPNTRSQLLT